MNELTVFKNADFGQMRTVEINGKTMFCGKDVAIALGYSNPRDALIKHCKEKGVMNCDSLTDGGKQKLKFIDEGNVYRLIAKSKLPAAEKFESWVFDDVLPSIRKTGSYSITQKQDSYLIEDRIERAKRWIEEAEYTRSLEVKNAELDADNKKLKPAATYAMNVLHHNKNLTSIDAVGRELGLNKNSMHKLLRDVKILCKCGSKYVLAAGHEDLGKGKKEYFLEKTYEQKGRAYPIQNSLAVTEKGRGYIIKHFDEWKIKAYGDQWREHLWSKAQLDKYYKSISE